MKTISVSEAENSFEPILREITSGEEIILTNNENAERVAVIIPFATWQKRQKRQLGTLQGKGTVIFEEDFGMTEEEFANL